MTSQHGKDLQPKFTMGQKQGGLQTTTYLVSYSVFLNCIALKPHTSRCWMAMLAMPTLTSAEQEIPLLFPYLPKPSWVPLQCSQQLLLAMPTAFPDKAGCGGGSFPAAWEAAPVQSPARVTSSAGSAGAPLVCRGNSAPNAGGILACDWAAGKRLCRNGAAGSDM